MSGVTHQPNPYTCLTFRDELTTMVEMFVPERADFFAGAKVKRSPLRGLYCTN